MVRSWCSLCGNSLCSATCANTSALCSTAGHSWALQSARYQGCSLQDARRLCQCKCQAGPGDSSVTWHDQPCANKIFGDGSTFPAQGIPRDIGHTHRACLQILDVWGAPGWEWALSDSALSARSVLDGFSRQKNPAAAGIRMNATGKAVPLHLLSLPGPQGLH